MKPPYFLPMSDTQINRKGDSMAERRTTVAYPLPTDPKIGGSDVPIKESTERWTEIHLEDGSVLKVKASVLSAIRVDGQYDPEGNPAYSVKTQLQMVVVTAPEHLKKTTDGGKLQ
jgi:hypothetical protein